MSSYLLHGVSLTVSTSSVDLSAAVHSRLRHFRSDGPASGGLRFEFQAVPESQRHAIGKPTVPLRSVYEPMLNGEVLYSDQTDLLYIGYGDRIRELCVPDQGRVQVSYRTPEDDLLWLLSHPLVTLPLIELLKRRGLYSLHAAGLCMADKGLLLAGGSGSGKTTLMLALLRAGFGFLGDDMLFLSPGHDGPRVLAFPDEIDVTEETLRFFPELHGLLTKPLDPGYPKRQVDPELIYGIKPTMECRPAALIFPQVAVQGESRLEAMSPMEAFMELAPNVLLTEANACRVHLNALKELAKGCDCYRLLTGRDFDALPALLGSLL